MVELVDIFVNYYDITRNITRLLKVKTMMVTKDFLKSWNATDFECIPISS